MAAATLVVLGGAGMMASGTIRDLVSNLSDAPGRIVVADRDERPCRALIEQLGGDPRLTARACSPDQGMPSQCELVAGPDFRSPNQPDEDSDRNVPYQISAGFVIERPLCYCRRQPEAVIWDIPA